MQVKHMVTYLQTAKTEIDADTGFRYRSVYTNNENSKLHYHDYYEIFLTLSPEIYHLVNGHQLKLSRGALVFIRKNDVHYYQPSLKSELSFINLAFTEETLNELFLYLTSGFCSDELLSAKLPPTIYISDSDIDWIIKKIEELNSITHQNSEKLKYHLRILLFRIFTRFFQNYKQSDSDDGLKLPTWLIDLDKKMHKLENFSQPPQHMVELSGKTRTHLGRVIKECYNMTIPQYIYEIRLNYFSNSLITTDYPIIDICYECGFENISWAYELFKNKYGVTPLNFRKQNRP